MQEIINYKKILSNKQDTGKYRHVDNTSFNLDILEGKINFISKIGSKSYWRLETEWLKKVKQLKAYFIWKSRKGKDWWNSEKAKLSACSTRTIHGRIR